MKLSALLSIFSASLFWIACESGPKPSTSESPKADTNSVKTDQLPMPRTWEMKTNTGKTIIANETHPKGASLSNVKIYFQGDSTGALTFTDIDPVSTMVVGDLDKNGFDELYMFSTSAGSGSYGTINGVSSNRDKSLSMLAVPEMDPNDLKPGKLFDGYEGHDRYAFENGVLIRRFPFKGDTLNMKSVPYKVIMGEGALIVTPKRN
jgi:hypothetical protein